MKANVISADGKVKEKIDLPKVFSTEYRPDVIKRAVLTAQANRRQPYGSDKMAGKRTSAHYHGLSHLDPAQRMMHREMARLPREHGDTARFMRARLAPQTVGGRRAHPPKPEKIWSKKINKRERILAIKSAIAGTSNPELVKERGHVFNFDLPFIVDDSALKFKKTKEFLDYLVKIGLKDEIERLKKKKKRSGKGKLRRGRYKSRIGPLLIVKDDNGISKVVRGVPGFDVAKVDNLNVEILSPGAHGIRLVIWTKSAIESLKDRWKENA
ncbi:MAG: 50S ribosomal protein L4 [Candidatus Aenigmarchaeota archaeon]|nr:50S ribosomal protein L4 [Candidatus Aenigmarchaeota archaeon]